MFILLEEVTQLCLSVRNAIFPKKKKLRYSLLQQNLDGHRM